MERNLEGILYLLPQCCIVDVQEICHFHLNGVWDITFFLAGDKSEHPRPSFHSLSLPPPLIPVSYSHSLITTPLGTCPYCRQTLLCPILAKHWILQLQEIKFKPWLPPSQTEIQNPASSRSMQCVTLCHISFERCK